jgi:hypothetical protein
MDKLISLILVVAQQLGANPGMDYFELLQLTLDIRSRQEDKSIPNPGEFLQYVLQNCTPDVLEQIFNSARTLVETLIQELDCEGRQMTFGEMMKAFREQRPPSHDPGELPPTFGLPRIILTFEVWDIVVNLNNYHMQMPAPAIEHSTPNPDDAMDWQ